MFRRGLLAFSLFFLSLPALAGEPARYSGALAFEQLQKFVNENQISSKDELLARMPKSLLANFTLAYESGGLHSECVTPERPRIVLFSLDERFVMALSGDTTNPQCRDAEILDEDASGELRTRVLKMHQSTSVAAACTECHSGTIWESYSRWEGFYGSNNDNIVSLMSKETPKGGEELQREYANFWKYKPQWMIAPIYRHLDWRGATSVHPYGPPESLDASLRPNLRLGILLADMQARHLFRKIKKHPRYAFEKYALAAEIGRALAGISHPKCDVIGPDPTKNRAAYVLSALGVTPQERWMAKVGKDVPFESSFHTGFTQLNDLVATLVVKEMVREMPELKPYLAQVDAYQSSAYRSKLGVNAADFLGLAYFSEAACEILNKKYQAAGGVFAASVSLPEAPKDSDLSSLTARCVRCHDGYREKNLPLDNEKEMRSMLRDNPKLAGEIHRRLRSTAKKTNLLTGEKGVMPPRGKLSEAEIKLLEDYVDKLSGEAK